MSTSDSNQATASAAPAGHSLTLTDYLWYGFGLAASFVIALGVLVNSIGKEHPLKRSDDSLRDARNAASSIMEQAGDIQTDALRKARDAEREALDSIKFPSP